MALEWEQEHLMTELFQDLSYALRQFRRAPAFTAAAVLTLALGIGAKAAIFSLVDQLLLKRLPVAEPDHLVMLKFIGSDTGHTSSYGGDGEQYFSYPMYRDLRDQNSVFSGMVTMFPTHVGVQWRNTPSLASSELVSGNYFSLLGVKPALGRLFVTDDSATRGAAPRGCSELPLLESAPRVRPLGYQPEPPHQWQPLHNYRRSAAWF
jgi:putative ABC transport system permease protein